MSALFELLRNIFESLRPWAIIEPWEEGIRIRCGRWYKHIKPGIYFQLPVLDTYYTRDVKPRVVNLPNQTVTTKDGKILTLSGALSYSIVDLLKTYLEVHDHEDSLVNLAMGMLAGHVASHTLADCGLETIQNKTAIELRREAKKWGIYVHNLYLTDLASVRVFRLVQDNQYRTIGSRSGADA